MSGSVKVAAGTTSEKGTPLRIDWSTSAAPTTGASLAPLIVTVTVALLARSAQANQSWLVENFTAYDPARWQAAGVVPGPDAATGALVGEIARQAAGIAYANDFSLLGATTLLTLPFVFLLRGPRS